MFEGMINFFKKLGKKEKNKESSDTAKERLHLVLMQDRANVSADFLELMREEIIEVIKKYIDVDEKAIDVRLTNKTNDDGTIGAPALYANIPIVTIKDEARVANVPHKKEEKADNSEEKKEEKKEEKVEEEVSEVKEEKSEAKEEAEETSEPETEKIIEEAKKLQDEVENEKKEDEEEVKEEVEENKETNEEGDKK